VCVSKHPSTASISTLSLHDALPISHVLSGNECAIESVVDFLLVVLVADKEKQFVAILIEVCSRNEHRAANIATRIKIFRRGFGRSEEHTSEQSRFDLVCRLLLDKKK